MEVLRGGELPLGLRDREGLVDAREGSGVGGAGVLDLVGSSTM